MNSLAAYTPKEWGEAVKLSAATVAKLIKDEVIESVTIGRSRRILTSPEDYYARIREEYLAKKAAEREERNKPLNIEISA